MRFPWIVEAVQVESETPPPFPLIKLPCPAAAPPTTTEADWQLIPTKLGSCSVPVASVPM